MRRPQNVPLSVVAMFALVACSPKPSQTTGDVVGDAQQIAPTIPPNHKAPLKCIYDILKANGAVRSIDVFALDGFRSAIEFTRVNEQGHVSTRDILLSGVLRDGTTNYFYGMPVDDQANWQFDMSLSGKLNSSCRLRPAFDNLLPPPPARARWRREKSPN
jgi:hypothetical protein